MTPETQVATTEAHTEPAAALRDEEVTQIPDLLDKAKNGDRDAFAALYREYLPTVYKFLYYRLNSNKAMAEDMTSEVFLRAVRKIEDFNWTGADFGAWLLRIARNLILDNAKSSRNRLEVLNDEMPEEAGGMARSSESAAMESWTNQNIYKAIKRLSPDQRDVITMRFIQGMDVPAVAVAMGKKEGTVRTLQFRGLKALQKLLVNDGVVDLRDTAIQEGGVRDSENGRSGSRTESEAARFGITDGER